MKPHSVTPQKIAIFIATWQTEKEKGTNNLPPTTKH
jgi:hypothetical protein